MYADYKDKLFTLVLLASVIEGKLKNVVKLLDEIQESLEQEMAFKEDFDKYTDFINFAAILQL